MNSRISPQKIYDTLKSLPDDSLQKVLEYIEFIRPSPKYEVDISENDIAEARKEMWHDLGETD